MTKFESEEFASCQDHEDWNPYTYAINHKSGILSFIMAKKLGREDFMVWFGQQEFYKSCAEAREIKPGNK